jgi:glyoxylase-like metal-dependent hydrolase (beta-lactamase superfamily II)
MEICDSLHGFIWRSMSANNCNTYFINSGKRVLIDPGHARYFDHVEQELYALGVSVDDIDVVLCTHAHPDHIEGVSILKRAGAQFAMHQADWELTKAMLPALQMDGRIDINDYTPDFFLINGDVRIGDIELQALHTPGHSPGSLCFYLPLNRILISGDLAFMEGVGRTDLPGGDSRQIRQSIEQVSSMPVATMLPGHGDLVVGEKKVKANFNRIKQIYLNYL